MFLQQTFEEIVNLYKKLLTLQLKPVQKRGTFVKELVKVSATEKSVIFWQRRFLHAQINLFESFLSNKKLEGNNGSVES